jgi:hypothetical protein
MGSLYPSTATFSFVTSSRYWMSGFVATGAIMVLYIITNMLFTMTMRKYKPPSWFRLWFYTSGVLVIIIPTLTMTTHTQPPLTAFLAVDLVIVTLFGLALALQAGSLAGQDPIELLLVTFDGVSISFILISLSGIEHIGEWISRGSHQFIILMTLMICAGFTGITVMTVMRYILRRTTSKSYTLFISGLCVAYPGLSILHHVFFTDGYYYITDSDNFFARNLLLQGSIWLFSWFVCISTTKLRHFIVDDKRIKKHQLE